MIACVGATPVYQRTMVFGRLTLDAVNRTAEVRDYASGKSVNVARVLATLGEESIALGFAGGDRGKSFLDDLLAAGITADFVAVSAQTRQCITLVDKATASATELVEESTPVGAEAWAELERRVARCQSSRHPAIWVFSGTLPPASPPDSFVPWMKRLAGEGATVIVDMQGEPLRLAREIPRLILKVNREELLKTVGAKAADSDGHEAILDAMRLFRPLGGSIVVTLGRDGALCLAGDAAWQVSTPKIMPVSAVGSGDAFAAGLSAGLHRGLALPEGCRLASACGAANALTPLAGHLHAADVTRLLSEVELRAM